MKQPANIKKGKKTTSFGEAKCRTEYKLFIVCGDGEKKTPSTSIFSVIFCGCYSDRSSSADSSKCCLESVSSESYLLTHR